MNTTVFLTLIALSIAISLQSQNYQPQNLGKNVNSEESEFAPFISADGKTLYFSSTNRPSNMGGTDDYSDIYFSRMQEDGTFAPAENMGKPINSGEYGEIVISVTPDGNTMLLSRKKSSKFLYISNRIKNGWSEPKPISIKGMPITDEVLLNLGSDGKTLLIGFKGEGGYGDLDLWVSFREDESTFSKPKNLGNVINTSSLEYSPFIAPDMKTLYFSSSGHGGLGGRDIFKSTRLDDSWTNWSKPENLGNTINTDQDEYYYCLSSVGDYAYVTTFYNSYGYLDIYKIPLPQAAKPKPVVLVSGKVINAKNNQFIEAGITYENLTSGEKMGIARSNPEDGTYLIVLPAGNAYAFMAEAPNFYAVSENIDLTAITENDKLVKDLLLKPLESGSVIKLNNVFFDFDKSTLKAESYPELNRLIDVLKKNADMQIEIAGHTDNVGKPDYNIQLSMSRANAVKEYLVKNGVSDKRIFAKGYGAAKPEVPNDTEEGKMQNRRVEFIIK